MIVEVIRAGLRRRSFLNQELDEDVRPSVRLTITKEIWSTIEHGTPTIVHIAIQRGMKEDFNDR